MPRFKPMELSQLAWAFATSGHEAPSVLSAVECEALRRQQQPGSLRLQPRELVTLAWSFAKAERLAPALMGTVLEGVEPAIVDSARGLNSQGLAMAAWSFARLGHPAPGLFAALATEVERRGLSDFQPQGLAMMAWAYARAGEGSGEGREAGGRLLGEIFSLVLDGDRRQWLLADFGPQGLAMLLWSAARTKHHSAPDLAEAAAEQLVPRAGGGREPLGDLSLRGLAMLAHACAAAGNMKNCCGERKCGWHFLLEALIPHVESPEKLRGGAQRDLATVAWAFSVCYPHENVGQLERLFAVMEDEAAPRVGRGEFGPLSLSMLMHSYARLRLPGSRLLEAAELPVRRMCSELPGECLGAQDCNATPGDLVVFAWCYARSGHRAAASVLPALAKQLAAPGWLAELSPLELTHIAWAYSGTAACAGSPVTPAGENPPVVSRLLDAICNQAMPKLTEFTDLGLATLAWAFANAGHPAPALFEAVACDVYRRLPALNPQCIATLTWAFARANESQSRPELINRLLDCVRPQLAEMGPQSLAMLLWSVAKAKHQADNFFAAAHPLVLERLCDFDSQGLAKVLWAFAVGSSLPTGEMFLRACEQAVPQLKEPLKAGSMAMALDAFEEAGADTGALHEAWRLRLLRDIYSGTP